LDRSALATLEAEELGEDEAAWTIELPDEPLELELPCSSSG
jgi:hypothetical protein